MGSVHQPPSGSSFGGYFFLNSARDSQTILWKRLFGSRGGYYGTELPFRVEGYRAESLQSTKPLPVPSLHQVRHRAALKPLARLLSWEIVVDLLSPPRPADIHVNGGIFIKGLFHYNCLILPGEKGEEQEASGKAGAAMGLLGRKCLQIGFGWWFGAQCIVDIALHLREMSGACSRLLH